MLSNNKIKYIQSLHAKKIRQKYENFLAEGDKICSEILSQPNFIIQELIATAEWLENNKHRLPQNPSLITEVEDDELKKISTLTTPNQVLMVVKQPQYLINNDIIKEELVLYLDGIQDPGNMGTILRIADWFGIPYVLCSDSCVEVYNPKVIQATMGAFLRVKTQEIALASVIDSDTLVYGALLSGQNVFKTTLSACGVIVIGNEGRGISDELLPLINRPILIPPHGQGAESLNAGVATGIICAAFRNK